MTSFIRNFLTAIQYFTRIPITGKLARWVGYSPQQLQASAAHFPGVGLLVGLITGTLLVGATHTLPNHSLTPLLAAFLSTFISILLTGAFHEDGLADTADGLGGGFDRSRALEIMKDSRIGTYGSLALLLVIGSKVTMIALLASINLTHAALTLVMGHLTSRWIVLLIMKFLRPITESDTSKSKPLVEGITGYHLFIGTLWVMFPFLIGNHFLPLKTGLCGISLALCVGMILACKWNQRLQGYTGDCLGATQQLTEIAFYLGTLFQAGN